MRRMLEWFAWMMAILLMLSSCSKPEQVPSDPPEPSALLSIPESSFQELEPEQPQTLNPLTGEAGFSEAALGKRPVAIMINNAGQALPQRGIGCADLIYEAVTEGGITRLLAIYADPDSIPYVGPVRSCRHYFLDLCEPFDAIYVHFGGSPAGKSKIKNLGIDDVDGIYDTASFYQDLQRKQECGQEHSFFIHAEGIASVMKRKGLSAEGDPSPLIPFASEPIIPEAGDAKNVYVPFSASTSSRFIYDDETGLYRKQRNNADQVDGNTGEVLTFQNIVIIDTDIYSYNGEALRRDMQFQRGTGYYITNGGKMAIHWTKGNESTPFVFTLPDGSKLESNTGKTYVCIIDSDDVTVQFSEES